MLNKLKGFLGDMDKTADEIREQKAQKAATKKKEKRTTGKNAQELLEELRKSRSDYFKSDDDDARAAAAAKGFDVGSGQDFEYKIPGSRGGVPATPFGFVPLYQRKAGDDYISTDRMAALLAHPEDASEWPKPSALMLACANDQNQLEFTPCPIEVIDKFLPEWPQVMGAFRSAYAEYVKSQGGAVRKGKHEIETVDDISTAELAELLKDGRYTMRSLSEMRPKELRKVYKKYFGKPKKKGEKSAEKPATDATATNNPDETKSVDTAAESEKATDTTATVIDEQTEAANGSTVEDAGEAGVEEPPVIVKGNELNQFISSAIDGADPKDVERIDSMSNPQIGELYKALTHLYEDGQQATPMHVRVFVSRILNGANKASNDTGTAAGADSEGTTDDIDASEASEES